MSLLAMNQPVLPQVTTGSGGLLGAMTPGLSQNPYSPMYGTNPYTQQALSLAGNGYHHGPFASVAAPPAVPTPTSSSPSTLSQLAPLLGLAGLAAGNNGLLGTAVQSGVKGVGNYLSGLLGGTPALNDLNNPGGYTSAGYTPPDSAAPAASTDVADASGSDAVSLSGNTDAANAAMAANDWDLPLGASGAGAAGTDLGLSAADWAGAYGGLDASTAGALAADASTIESGTAGGIAAGAGGDAALGSTLAGAGMGAGALAGLYGLYMLNAKQSQQSPATLMGDMSRAANTSTQQANALANGQSSVYGTSSQAAQQALANNAIANQAMAQMYAGMSPGQVNSNWGVDNAIQLPPGLSFGSAGGYGMNNRNGLLKQS